jgi:VWFA-related protein
MGSLIGLIALAHEQHQPTAPQEPEPTISLESNLVDVVFTVTDANNRFITDLRPESAQILEDGVPQTIEFFGRNAEVPMVLALVVDFSGSQEFNWPRERDAALKFFSEFFRWGKDYAALLTFRGIVRLQKGLTNDQTPLEAALKSLIRVDEGYASQGTSLYDAAYVATDEVLDGPTARRILKRNDQRIRRALLLITDGHDTSSLRKEPDVIERAQRAGVLIFPIGISDSFRFADVNAKTLDQLAGLTGGRAYYPGNEEQLRAAFKQIAEELSSQYVVAYYPSNTARDGCWRQLEVKIVGRDGLSVSHRAGYFAPKER